jgi:hypothetical protein
MLRVKRFADVVKPHCDGTSSQSETHIGDRSLMKRGRQLASSRQVPKLCARPRPLIVWCAVIAAEETDKGHKPES